jgi:hypothetical protein
VLEELALEPHHVERRRSQQGCSADASGDSLRCRLNVTSTNQHMPSIAASHRAPLTGISGGVESTGSRLRDQRLDRAEPLTLGVGGPYDRSPRVLYTPSPGSLHLALVYGDRGWWGRLANEARRT